MVQWIEQRLPAWLSLELGAAILLLAVGAALRLYSLGVLPTVIQQDEPAAAYDAWALLNFGIDRNGFSWPVHFVSWGSGQNALYSYLAMPFIALGGLNTVVFRLPMVISGVLALYLMWKIGERAAGRRFALLVLLLLALSSWHLIASRWGSEGNLMPFVLLVSVYLLARPDRGRFWVQAVAVAVLALSVYAYGTAYALAPLFLGLVFVWLRLNGLADWRRLLLLSVLAGLTALPIMLLVAVNSLGWDTIEFFGVSIPRYSGTPRYESLNLLLVGDGGRFWDNLPRVVVVLLGGSGNWGLSLLPWVGALPPLAILVGFLGWGAVLYRAKVEGEYGIHLLLAFWFGAALLVTLLSPAGITRMNGLWLPAIYLIGWGAFLVGRYRRLWFYGLAAVYGAYSSFFLYQYLEKYDDVIAAEISYHRGIGMAIERAVEVAGGEGIYVTDIPFKLLTPYIYALFYTQPPPGEYLETRVVADPNAAFKRNLAYGQFVFVSPWREDRENRYRRLRQAEGVEARQVGELRDRESRYLRLLEAGGVDLEGVAHYILTEEAAAELDLAGMAAERYGNYYYVYDPERAAAGAARGPLLRRERPAVAEPAAARDKFDIYREGNTLTYYKKGCTADDTREPFFLHIVPVNRDDLPAERRPLGFANRDFRFGKYGALYGYNCWAVVELPEYPVAGIRTGQFVDGAGELWRVEFAVGE